MDTLPMPLEAMAEASGGLDAFRLATPTEILESEAPILIESKVLVPDSGGPGRSRGGPIRTVTIDPDRGDAGAARPLDVRHHVVAHVQGALGSDAASPTRPSQSLSLRSSIGVMVLATPYRAPPAIG